MPLGVVSACQARQAIGAVLRAGWTAVANTDALQTALYVLIPIPRCNRLEFEPPLALLLLSPPPGPLDQQVLMTC